MDELKSNDLEQTYCRQNRRKIVFTISFILVAVVFGFISLFISKIDALTPSITWDVLVAHFTGGSVDNELYDLVVWEYNMPRSILGLFVGAGLGVGGAVMQSLMRNPLADPYTTGVASGASFGAALFITLGISLIPIQGYYASLTLNALLLALVPTFAILLISQRKTITPTTMILAGIAIMYVFRAATSFMMLTADSENVEQVYIWQVGTLGTADWNNIWIVGAMVVLCSIILMFLSRPVTTMIAGDKNAKSMGVQTKLVRLICLFTIAIMTATIVGYTGTIGFMGLVAPHVARMVVGSNLRYLIPCSATMGALILVAADCVAKSVSMTGLPVGIITSLVGGPIFIILLIKGAKKVWY